MLVKPCVVVNGVTTVTVLLVVLIPVTNVPNGIFVLAVVVTKLPICIPLMFDSVIVVEPAADALVVCIVIAYKVVFGVNVNVVPLPTALVIGVFKITPTPATAKPATIQLPGIPVPEMVMPGWIPYVVANAITCVEVVNKLVVV